MKTINVLSVDWDFFVDASNMERCILFPDGNTEEIDKFTRSLIWGCRYTNPVNGKALRQIGFNTHLLLPVVEAIANSKIKKMYVADSHKHCYEFVKDAAADNAEAKINIVNIDFHHDVYGAPAREATDIWLSCEQPSVHCGNWLYILKRDGIDLSATWIKRADSDMFPRCGAPWLHVKNEDAVCALPETNWDYVYIARSDVWSPPHLDGPFATSFQQLAEKNNAIIGDDVFDSAQRIEACHCFSGLFAVR